MDTYDQTIKQERKVQDIAKVLPNWFKLLGIVFSIFGFVGYYFFHGFFGFIMVLGIIVAAIGFKWKQIIGE